MARRTVRGFAWLVYPKAQAPGDRFHPGKPFDEGAEPGVDLPPGVIDFWPVVAEFGLQDDRTGGSFLVLTRGPVPPTITATYRSAPAEFDAGMALSGGLVRIGRVLGTRPTDRGDLRECECEVDEEPDNPPPS